MDKKPSYNDLIQKIKKLELLLKDNEERYNALSEAANEGIFITENSICIEANKIGCDLFGYSYDEIIGINALDVFADESKETVKNNIKDEYIGKYQVIGLKKDGTKFYVEILGRNYLYKGRNVRIASIQDITEQKAAQKALVESESKFRNVVEKAGDGILIGNLKGEIIDVNKSFLKMTGYSRNEVINTHISSLFNIETLKEKPMRFDLIDKGETVIIERDIKGKGGNYIPIEMNSKKLSNKYYLAIIRDLREHRKAAEELKKTNKELLIAKEKAEESDHLKSSFLANMSHEIRTPMNGIIGFSELLKQNNLNPQTRSNYLDVIISSGQQLLTIINDVLEISRIETGQIEIIHMPVNVTKLIKELEVFFTPSTHHNHNQIKLILPEHEIEVINDEAKIRQVLTNLINNANKFTQNGTITIQLTETKKYIGVSIKDTGIGIPDDFINKIFDRFLQVDHQNKIGSGTGLGLSISKKLIELMKGTISVHSKIDFGSTFKITLPR